ncbi:MAG: tyrosine-type recombinase/integrase [Actinobacteria bacterium]|nr:tyrosine-type recombinase/integrase [Actinomycetota bacterium]
MAVRKRGGRYQVDVAVNGQRWRGSARTEDGARIREAQVRASLMAGKAVEVVAPGKAPTTLGQLASRVIDQVWAGTKNERTVVHNANCAVKFFGANQPIGEIDTAMVDTYITHLKAEGNTNSTVNRKLNALSKMLGFAHKRGWLTGTPHYERQKELAGRVRFLTVEEEGQVTATMAHFGCNDEARLVEFLIDTGLRRGEWQALTWRDYDRKSGTITLWETKNGHARTVPLTKRAADIILTGVTAPARGVSRPPTDKVFDYITDDNFRSAWNRTREHLGLNGDKDFVPHMLRHTCASRLVQRGVPITVVKEFLGHKAIQVTMRYAHLAPANLWEAARALEGE